MTSSPDDRHHNGLANETSPYLLQHANNPVDWLPWGEEAFAIARKTGKPILLSVGYSACHWCHVMAHESFEDQTTANVMNRHFINIKVDREERPDVDKIYQLAHQLLTQRSGGWPLTMFLTPDDLTPFFGGTYFPPSPRHGLPAFKDLLLRVIDFLLDHADEVVQQNVALRDALARAEHPQLAAGGPQLCDAPLSAARAQLERVFDARDGGFGREPKFPHPTNLERLTRHYAQRAISGDPDPEALHIVTHTLERMARGGIYDHVGGGFCRYSVDAQWMIPHFEKMLYDNGPLLCQYAKVSQLTGRPFFASVAGGIGDWVMREMQSPEGGYFSSLDADSEGEEGRFYLWTPALVKGLLDDDEYAAVSAVFGLDRPPNFEGREWHLHVYERPHEVALKLGKDEATVQARLDSATLKLFAAREPRVRPGRDEKVLVSWNALMITGMATAARLLGREDFAVSAQRARDFLRAEMWNGGRLFATYKDGRAHLNAYLDDYAFLLEALLELLALRWHAEDLDWAIAIADVLLDQFEDSQTGGFFFTANDHEPLLHRTKSFMDDALPAGNGVACSGLLRLGHLLGEMRYVDTAQRALDCAWAGMNQTPHAHNAMLNALEDYLSPAQIVVLRATPRIARPWLARANRVFSPRRAAFSIPPDEADLPGLLAERRPLQPHRDSATAYLCTGHQCEAPIVDFELYASALASQEITPASLGR